MLAGVRKRINNNKNKLLGYFQITRWPVYHLKCLLIRFKSYSDYARSEIASVYEVKS